MFVRVSQLMLHSLLLPTANPLHKGFSKLFVSEIEMIILNCDKLLMAKLKQFGCSYIKDS